MTIDKLEVRSKCVIFITLIVNDYFFPDNSLLSQYHHNLSVRTLQALSMPSRFISLSDKHKTGDGVLELDQALDYNQGLRARIEALGAQGDVRQAQSWGANSSNDGKTDDTGIARTLQVKQSGRRGLTRADCAEERPLTRRAAADYSCFGARSQAHGGPICCCAACTAAGTLPIHPDLN